MSRLLGLSLLALVAACASSPATARTETKIFRWIAIGPVGRDTIRLGEPLGEAGRYAERTSDTTYRLRAGTFGGADSIEFRVTSQGLVKEMHFTYAPNTDWAEIGQSYAQSLGPGTSIQMTEGRDLVRWEDERTRFVIGTGGRAGRRIKAALIDLRLAR